MKRMIATLVGIIEVKIEGRTATALMFDNMRWMIDFSSPADTYELGDLVTFTEEDAEARGMVHDELGHRMKTH